MERIIIRTAAGFDVIAGERLNDKPLDRAAADRLAKGSPATTAASPPSPLPAPPPAAEPNRICRRTRAWPLAVS
jgi:hypothetical protein